MWRRVVIPAQAALNALRVDFRFQLEGSDHDRRQDAISAMQRECEMKAEYPYAGHNISIVLCLYLTIAAIRRCGGDARKLIVSCSSRNQLYYPIRWAIERYRRRRMQGRHIIDESLRKLELDWSLNVGKISFMNI